MIEVYVIVALSGIGYFMNKNKQIKNKQNVKYTNKDLQKQIKDSDNPFKNTVYDSKMMEKVKKDESTGAKGLFDENKAKKGEIKHEYKSNLFFKDDKNETSELSGKKVFMTHNNMVPFFKGTMNKMDSKSPLLESFTGNSELYRTKDVVKDLFIPQKDNTTGMPVNTDAYQARFQKPLIMNNVTPVPQIRVGKGIGQGYDSTPVGGYQQLDERDYVMPKNVDDLRAKNNPKMSFQGKIIDGQKTVKRANKPTFVKNKADTFYKNNPERYFTTTGQEIKQAVKPEIEVKYTTRPETNVTYKGNAFYKKEGDRPETLAPYSTFRQELEGYESANPTLAHKGKGDKYGYGKESIMVYDNNRNVISEKTYQGNVISLVKSITAPVLDILKINKKEYTIENPREMGQLQSYVQKQTIQNEDIARTTVKETLLQESTNINLQGHKRNLVYDPNDIARTTIKETLLQESELINIDARRTGAITRNDDQATTTLRETMEPVDTVMNLNSDNKGNVVKDPNDIARTTIKETVIDNNREGNVITDSRGAYIEANYEAKDTQKQYLSQNEYIGNVELSRADGYKVAPVDLRPTQKEELCDNEYYGNAADQSAKEPLSYEAIYNATMNELKEELEKGRDPTNTSVKVNASYDKLGDENSKKINLNYKPNETKTFVNQPLYKNIPCDSITRERQEHSNTRFDTSLLGSLKDNPYDIRIFK